jgi:MraZ protein
MGHHLNRLDAKGRVSIPAPFRTALRTPGADGTGPVSLVLRPSHTHACIEGWPVPEFERLAEPLLAMPVFSDDHDTLATALYADAFTVESDREGRVILPGPLAAHAGLSEGVAFMGMGRWFQIWEPAAAERRRAEARERSRSRGLAIPGVQQPAQNSPQHSLGTPRA